jgi:truncated hemoglobin YjbI
MATTLYEKMGGESAIKEMVDDFYRDVLADEIQHFA